MCFPLQPPRIARPLPLLSKEYHLKSNSTGGPPTESFELPHGSLKEKIQLIIKAQVG